MRLVAFLLLTGLVVIGWYSMLAPSRGQAFADTVGLPGACLIAPLTLLDGLIATVWGIPKVLQWLDRRRNPW